jgi:nucleoside-diphosphate-sugar epimerase
MNNICVIGGSGFIGTRLCNRLTANKFTIADIRPSPLFSSVKADVRCLDDLLEAIKDDDIIINLAAEHRDNVTPRSLYEEVNVDGARNICLAARTRGVKTIIFTSSVAVYGFAPRNTAETGAINPFNDYGRSKYQAEQIYREWQKEDPSVRCLVIVRPTVVFGEQNRGNVYNLLRQIASGFFVMIGDGKNQKSIAYVENVAAFLQHSLSLGPGVYLFNYVDKPDFSMNSLVDLVKSSLGKSKGTRLRIPYALGLVLANAIDLIAVLTGRKLAISAIRVKKFCSDSLFKASFSETGFIPPVNLVDGLEKTIRHEFIESHEREHIFFTE